MGLSALELVNLLAGGPKKPAMAPADATAVARNKGPMPVSPEEAKARASGQDFTQHRDTFYDKYGTGASEHQGSGYDAAALRDGTPMAEPFGAGSPGARGDSIHSAYVDLSYRARHADDDRQAANAILAKLLQQASKQSGQRKVAP